MHASSEKENSSSFKPLRVSRKINWLIVSGAGETSTVIQSPESMICSRGEKGRGVMVPGLR